MVKGKVKVQEEDSTKTKASVQQRSTDSSCDSLTSKTRLKAFFPTTWNTRRLLLSSVASSSRRLCGDSTAGALHSSATSPVDRTPRALAAHRQRFDSGKYGSRLFLRCSSTEPVSSGRHRTPSFVRMTSRASNSRCTETEMKCASKSSRDPMVDASADDFQVDFNLRRMVRSSTPGIQPEPRGN